MKLDEKKLDANLKIVVRTSLTRYQKYLVKEVIGSWSSDVTTVIQDNKLLADGKDWRVYFYVNDGTPRHDISPGKSPFLVIPEGGYSRKTGKGGKPTGGVGYNQSTSFAFIPFTVTHPGQEAMNITEEMVESEREANLRAINDAVLGAIITNG